MQTRKLTFFKKCQRRRVEALKLGKNTEGQGWGVRKLKLKVNRKILQLLIYEVDIENSLNHDISWAKTLKFCGTIKVWHAQKVICIDGS